MKDAVNKGEQAMEKQVEENVKAITDLKTETRTLAHKSDELEAKVDEAVQEAHQCKTALQGLVNVIEGNGERDERTVKQVNELKLTVKSIQDNLAEVPLSPPSAASGGAEGAPIAKVAKAVSALANRVKNLEDDENMLKLQKQVDD